MSMLENLIKLADANTIKPGYMDCAGNKNSVLKSIEIGTLPSHYHASIEEKKPRCIEVWLHLNRPISADECEEFAFILQHNDIDPDDIECNGLYDYHMPFFSVAWLADIMPKLLDEDTKNKSDSQPEQSLMEFALSHGCDFMDMSTMTIYKAR